MQTDKNDMKVEKSDCMHLHEFEQPWKSQIVTDTKSHSRSHMNSTQKNLQTVQNMWTCSKLNVWCVDIAKNAKNGFS